MFNDPNHPDLERLAQHHDAGTHDQIPAQEAAAAVAAFHEQANPQIVQQVTAQHYENMAPAQLQQAAQQLKDKLASVAGASPAAAQMAASVDPTTATPQQVAAMHHFILKEHPEVMRGLLIGGGAIAVGALAAFAARRYLASHGR